MSGLEALYEDDGFAQRQLAALVASKVFYHLGELDEALTYALCAGSLFDVNEDSEYVHTLIAKALDSYFEQRVKAMESKSPSEEIDARLTLVVEKMIERCCEQGLTEQAVGVAMESRRLDKLEEVIKRSSDMTKALKYSLKACQKLIVSRKFRQQVLRLLISLYETVPQPDYLDICQCLMFLDDSREVSSILSKLLQAPKESSDHLLAYQICFDLVENEMQSFLIKVQEGLDTLIPPPPTADTAPAPAPAPEANAMETDEAPVPPAPPPSPLSESEIMLQSRIKLVRDILSGATPIGLFLDFLFRHNHADIQILKTVKAAVEGRNSVTHSATVMANAFMHVGTTVDTFLRENLDWLAKATNWAKFSATAGLGVIHKGHLSQGRALMAPYLPRNGGGGPSSSAFSEGGALFALGLIYANHGHDVRSFLLESLRNTSHEVIQHGACLGLGLSALGTNDDEICEDIKNVLYTDSAVAGEAAGIGMGLLLAGSASDKCTEMLAYAHDTQHEKIIRGIAIGLALIMYGQEEGADTLIEQMTRDLDPIIRYGGMYVIGMAYRGTGNNGAVQQLLHFAVSDVSDDVRRAAVLCLGFVLMGNPEQCPKIVSLLAESYNPHVRYGAAMAVGMACGGTGLKDAVSLLESLLTDSTDTVRQGALIALALVMMQQPESRLGPFRKRLEKLIKDKHEETMSKMGAIMATGIIDAGGRNVTVGLRSRSGYFRRTSVISLAVFTQYWYWYPLSHFLSLAFQPTALVGLNASMQMPKFEATVNCRPATFAYPAPIVVDKKEEVSKVPTAVLSTTHKAKERAKLKKQEADKKGKADDTMETDEAKPSASEGAKGEEVKAEATPIDLPGPYSVENPFRVVPSQVKFVSFKPESRWAPIQSDLAATAGIFVLKDSKPDLPVELAYPAPPAPAPAPAAPAAEVAPPAPFEYDPTA